MFFGIRFIFLFLVRSDNLGVQRTFNKLGTNVEPLDLFILSSSLYLLSVPWPGFEVVLLISSNLYSN